MIPEWMRSYTPHYFVNAKGKITKLIEEEPTSFGELPQDEKDHIEKILRESGLWQPKDSLKRRREQ